VLDLSELPVIINTPGHYILGRNWNVGRQPVASAIEIQADDVTLDFFGFEIIAQHDGDGIVIEGDDFTLRNGRLNRDPSNGSVIRGTGARTVIEKFEGLGAMSVFAVTLGESARVENSFFTGTWGVSLGSGSLESTRILCSRRCVNAAAGARIVDNELSSANEGAVELVGSEIIFDRNFITLTHAGPAIDVAGDRNLISDNVVASFAPDAAAIVVNGTANILKDNLARSKDAQFRWPIGIAFNQDGNFYGDNQMEAIVPFSLGGTVQTDWGGNLGF
jgi:hypothetical protein